MTGFTAAGISSATPASDRMAPFQIAVIGLCVFINALDGFDVLAMAFTAPAISREWSLNPTEVGLLFSSGLAGMCCGAFLISPLGDKFGRRPTILLCLALMTAGMLLSAISQTATQLAVTRIIAGLGIGGILPNINTIVAEYASPRRRSLAIALMTLGYPVGAILGGLISASLIQAFGWHSVFVIGGVLSALLIPLTALLLPESIQYLASRPSGGALAKINRIRNKMNAAPLDAMPLTTRHGDESGRGFFRVFQGPLLRITASALVLNMLVMSSVYFTVSWMPNIISSLGFGDTIGIYAATLMNVVGIFGSLLFGMLADRIGLRLIATIVFLGLAVSLIIFGAVPAETLPIIIAAILCGFFFNAAITSLYTILPRVFPSDVRATGTGIGLGAGRAGAVIGPFIAGLLMTDGWGRLAYCTVLAIPSIIAVFVLAGLGKALEKQSN